MGLNLELVKQHATVYGTPVYKEIVNYGTVSPGEYTVNVEFGSLEIQTEHGPIYPRLWKDVDVNAIDPKKDIFTVACFEVQRDTEDDGVFKALKKGTKKDFAYIAA